jgi:CRISPR system Cascade subunit CasE
MSGGLWLSRITFARAPTLYNIHVELWRAFEPVAPRPFLFRADAPPPGGGMRLLVQSVLEPDWSRLGNVLADVAGPKPYAPDPSPGARYRFFLRANAVGATKKGPRFSQLSREAFRQARGMRVGLRSDTERIAWLVRRSETHGFEVASHHGELALTLGIPFVERWQRGRRGPPTPTARHDGVDFEGVLVVRDSDRFARAVAKGIGRARAFGFGLLSLAPA